MSSLGCWPRWVPLASTVDWEGHSPQPLAVCDPVRGHLIPDAPSLLWSHPFNLHVSVVKPWVLPADHCQIWWGQDTVCDVSSYGSHLSKQRGHGSWVSLLECFATRSGGSKGGGRCFWMLSLVGGARCFLLSTGTDVKGIMYWSQKLSKQLTDGQQFGYNWRLYWKRQRREKSVHRTRCRWSLKPDGPGSESRFCHCQAQVNLCKLLKLFGLSFPMLY